jgi:hypothetical protein
MPDFRLWNADGQKDWVGDRPGHELDRDMSRIWGQSESNPAKRRAGSSMTSISAPSAVYRMIASTSSGEAVPLVKTEVPNTLVRIRVAHPL